MEAGNVFLSEGSEGDVMECGLGFKALRKRAYRK